MSKNVKTWVEVKNLLQINDDIKIKRSSDEKKVFCVLYQNINHNNLSKTLIKYAQKIKCGKCLSVQTLH